CDKVILTLLSNEAIPFIHNIVHIIDSGDKRLYQLFFASKLRTCINCLLDGDQNFFILTMSIMILFHQHEDVVNVNFNLLNKLNFKYDIVNDIGSFTVFAFSFPLISQILISTKIILQITLANNLFLSKFI